MLFHPLYLATVDTELEKICGADSAGPGTQPQHMGAAQGALFLECLHPSRRGLFTIL